MGREEVGVKEAMECRWNNAGGKAEKGDCRGGLKGAIEGLARVASRSFTSLNSNAYTNEARMVDSGAFNFDRQVLLKDLRFDDGTRTN